MNDEIKTLIQNLTDTKNTLNENNSLKHRLAEINDEIRRRITSETEKIRNNTIEKLKIFDNQIGSVTNDTNAKIDLIKQDLGKANTDYNNRVNQIINYEISPLDNKIAEVTQTRTNLYNRNSKIRDLKKNKFFQYVLFPKNFTQWFIFIFVFLICYTIISSPFKNGFVQLILFAGAIYGYVYLRRIDKKNEKQIQVISNELATLNTTKQNTINEIRNNPIDETKQLDDLKLRIANLNQEVIKLETLKTQKVNELNNEKFLKEKELSEKDDNLILEAEKNINSMFREEIEKINLKIKSNDNFLEVESRVGYEYQVENILLKLISYIRSERAVNLKEAIELYLQEKRYMDEKNSEEDFKNKQLMHMQQQIQIDKEIKEKNLKLEEQKAYTLQLQAQSEMALAAAEQNRLAQQAEMHRRELQILNENKKQENEILAKSKAIELSLREKELQIGENNKKMELNIQKELKQLEFEIENRKLKNSELLSNLDKVERYKVLNELKEKQILIMNSSNTFNEYEKNTKLKELEKKINEEVKKIVT